MIQVEVILQIQGDIISSDILFKIYFSSSEQSSDSEEAVPFIDDV